MTKQHGVRAVGVHAYGGSMTIAAREAGMEVLAQLEADREHHRIAQRFFGDRLVLLDEDRRWSHALGWIEEGGVDVVFGQPSVGRFKGRSVGNAGLETKDLTDFVRVAKRLAPIVVVWAGPSAAIDKVAKILPRRLPGREWFFVKTNAILHGLPHDKGVTFAVGVGEGAAGDAMRRMHLGICSAEEITDSGFVPVLWPVIEDLSGIEAQQNGSRGDGVAHGGRVVSSHVVPSRTRGVLSRILWESIPILGEGQTFDDVEGRPDVWREKGGARFGGNGGYFLKSQLPVRLSRSLPASSIYSAERYIHPTLDRPMTLRELARLFGLPDNYDLGSYYGPGLVALGRSTPVPAARWMLGVVALVLGGKRFGASDRFRRGEPYDLFGHASRSALNDLKRKAGKWVEAYAKKGKSGLLIPLDKPPSAR